MAQNTRINIPDGTWTLLTNSDVTAVSVQNISGHGVFIQATAGAIAPPAGNLSGAALLNSTAGLISQDLAEMFLGVAAPTRLYAYAPSGGAVWISHA